MSNIVSSDARRRRPGAGGIMAGFADNSSTLFAKWIIKSGEIQPQVSGTDKGLGAVPPTPLADAVTLDGGNFRPNANFTIDANRGITLGSAGGGLNPINAITFTVNSKITGRRATARIPPEQREREDHPQRRERLHRRDVGDRRGGNDTHRLAPGIDDQPAGQHPGRRNRDAHLRSDHHRLVRRTISSTGKLAKNNTGIVYLMSANTYTGGTTINGGVLVANSTASLPGYATAGKVIVNSGGDGRRIRRRRRAVDQHRHRYAAQHHHLQRRLESGH
jgi:autotransporter-associated beta strand protein